MLYASCSTERTSHLKFGVSILCYAQKRILEIELYMHTQIKTIEFRNQAFKVEFEIATSG